MTREEIWKELKETIIELRDSEGTLTQQEIFEFLDNYMGVLEKQITDCCSNNYEIESVYSFSED